TRLEVLDGPAAEVPALVDDVHAVGADPGQLTHADEDLVGAVPHPGQAEVDPAARRSQTLGDVEQGVQPGLVVGHVDDHGPAPPVVGGDREDVHPPRVVLQVRGERAQALDDRLAGQAEAERGGRGGQRVGDVV